MGHRPIDYLQLDNVIECECEVFILTYMFDQIK